MGSLLVVVTLLVLLTAGFLYSVRLPQTSVRGFGAAHFVTTAGIALSAFLARLEARPEDASFPIVPVLALVLALGVFAVLPLVIAHAMVRRRRDAEAEEKRDDADVRAAEARPKLTLLTSPPVDEEEAEVAPPVPHLRLVPSPKRGIVGRAPVPASFARSVARNAARSSAQTPAAEVASNATSS